MTETKSVKTLKKQLGAAIAMVLVAAVALGSSTYAWFVSNTKVTAEKVTMSATAAQTLLISESGQNNWNTILVRNDNNTTFVPVSTTGKTSMDDKTMLFAKDNAWTADNQDGNKAYVTGYENATANQDYYSTTFDIKSSVACKLYLDDETVFTAAVNATATNEMLKAMRMAVLVEQNGSIAKTYIYELDDQAISGNGNSYNTTNNKATTDVNGIAKAVKVTKGTTDNTFATDSISADNTVSKIKLATAPTDASFVTTTNGADELASMAANEVVKIHVYMWMEGCDYDCNSSVVANITGQTVTANLGFAAAAAN